MHAMRFLSIDMKSRNENLNDVSREIFVPKEWLLKLYLGILGKKIFFFCDVSNQTYLVETFPLGFAKASSAFIIKA